MSEKQKLINEVKEEIEKLKKEIKIKEEYLFNLINQLVELEEDEDMETNL